MMTISSAFISSSPADLRFSFENASDYSAANYLSTIFRSIGTTSPPVQNFAQNKSLCRIECFLSWKLKFHLLWFIGLPGIIIENIAISNLTKATLNFTNGISVLIPAPLTSRLQSPIGVFTIVYEGSDIFAENQTISSVIIASNVLSLQISGIESHQIFEPPIEISFPITKVNTSSSTIYKCAYYDFSDITWKYDGCMVESVNTTSNRAPIVTCKCSHLTNFAVLLDQGGNTEALSQLNQLVLGLITSIGCSISIALMAVIVLLYFIFPVCEGCKICNYTSWFY